MRALILLLVVTAAAAAADPAIDRAVAELTRRVPRFRVVELPAGGELTLTAEQSLTIEDLRGIPLDDDPPVLGAPAGPYDPRQTDDWAPGTAPYVAPGIAPFRLREFTCEFSYGGWHNLAMHDYAAAHGFSVIYPYVRPADRFGHWPAGTGRLKWGGFVNWHEWLPKHGIADGRYDLLVGRDVVGELLASGFLEGDDPAAWDVLMIDLEHGLLGPDQLREQAWFPHDAAAAEQAAFEARYYAGYALTYTAPVEAAARRGYQTISLYGWQPFPRSWYGLENLQLDPATYQPWQAYGRAIYQCPELDILNPDVYAFYWSPQNVAYTLVQLDLCRQLVESEPERKPMRAYYWTLLHGGSANYNWWFSQPVPIEEARAWTLLGFFCGIDGQVQWNWSDVGNHHRPRPWTVERGGRTVGNDLMLRDGFELRPEGRADGPPTRFERYDCLRVVSVDGGVVRFWKIDRYNWGGQFGLTPEAPVYAMSEAELTGHLRCDSEPIQGVVEGLALVKVLEGLLKRGRPAPDVSSLEQYHRTLPIVRRVDCGRYQVLATYDPAVVHGGEPRSVVLTDFAGAAGRTLTLPADAETRIWILRSP